MSGFSSDWLALREPYDHAARARETELALELWARDRGRLEVVDLGAGTGANLRRLAASLPVPQSWTLVEHDPALILAGRGATPPGVPVVWRRLDLASELEAALEGHVDLVTCAALLDLVSAAWLGRLVRLVQRRNLALLAVLSYDGRVALDPAHALDGEVIDLVNRHQGTDKGFGPALGPRAATELGRLLHAAGDEPLVALSDWVAGPEDRALQTALVEGWAAAAAAIAPGRATAIGSWMAERLEAIAAGRASCRVGHLDVLRLPRRQGRAP